jgi:ribokinase
MRAAVVGHVEWIDFIRVEAVPGSGDIVHAADWWEEPGGGGAVAAVQLSKLAGAATFFTALGNDGLGARAFDELSRKGLRMEATFHPTRQRRGVTFIDSAGERTITVMGERLAPEGEDALAWEELELADVVYVTGGDLAVLRRARRAGVVVATSRIVPLLADARIQLDALVGSARDPAERYAPGDLDPPPRLVVMTAGERGGTYAIEGSDPIEYEATPVPGRIVDTYGAGDSFAAGLAFALARGDAPQEAVSFAARCGAAVLAGRGPYEGQLKSADL